MGSFCHFATFNHIFLLLEWLMLILKMARVSNNDASVCTSYLCRYLKKWLSKHTSLAVSSGAPARWLCTLFVFGGAESRTNGQWNLFSVIYKVLTYLRSPNWDTRIAAGQAVEAIVKNIPEWKPAPKPKEGEHLCVFFFVLFLIVKMLEMLSEGICVRRSSCF